VCSLATAYFLSPPPSLPLLSLNQGWQIYVDKLRTFMLDLFLLLGVMSIGETANKPFREKFLENNPSGDHNPRLPRECFARFLNRNWSVNNTEYTLRIFVGARL
jgi:hypothetical protein